ncbi:MAG: T9SS C-terminal target domain-containing protein [Bacteroidetes bacterium]|nr:MAG: T9SS C-terminal target domain-containing protein [Bacteroidota bacterium]
MKPVPSIFFLYLQLFPAMTEAQIVINQWDMPVAGDTLRVSITSIVPVDYSKTGRDTTWDFSMLQPMSQRVDTFVSASNTPPEYWLFFIPGVVTNLASPRGNSEFFPGFPINQFYTFYNNTSAAYVDAGFAFKIQGIPVLQVDSEGFLTTATYLDSTRMPSVGLSVSLGPDTAVSKGAVVPLHASVTGGTPPYRYFWSTLDTGQSLTVTMDSTQQFGVVVIDGLNGFASDQKLVTVVSPGIEEQESQLLSIYPNPSSGLFRIHLPRPGQAGTLVVHSWSGKEILRQEVSSLTALIELDLTTSPGGIYMIRLTTGKGVLTGKVVKLP